MAALGGSDMGFAHRLTAWLGQVLSLRDGVDPSLYLDHLEKDFSVRFSDDELKSVRTLGDMQALLTRKLLAAGSGVNGEGVWSRLRQITSAEFGIDEAELHEGIRFAEDLLV